MLLIHVPIIYNDGGRLDNRARTSKLRGKEGLNPTPKAQGGEKCVLVDAQNMLQLTSSCRGMVHLKRMGYKSC